MSTGTYLNICSDQNEFDKVFENALINREQKILSSSQMIIWSLVFLIFFIWAIWLAFKYTKKGESRIIHLVLAMAFSPFYILAYFLKNTN